MLLCHKVGHNVEGIFSCSWLYDIDGIHNSSSTSDEYVVLLSVLLPLPSSGGCSLVFGNVNREVFSLVVSFLFTYFGGTTPYATMDWHGFIPCLGNTPSFADEGELVGVVIVAVGLFPLLDTGREEEGEGEEAKKFTNEMFVVLVVESRQLRESRGNVLGSSVFF